MTGSKESDVAPRHTRMRVMGDGTTNTALKGSPTGRRQRGLPCPGTPARHRGGEMPPRFGIAPAQMPLFQPSPWFPKQRGRARYGFLLSCQCFCRDGARTLLESDLAGATLLPAWQLLPLRPGTSGLKIAVKVTLV